MNYVGALLLGVIVIFAVIEPAAEEVANTMNNVAEVINNH